LYQKGGITSCKTAGTNGASKRWIAAALRLLSAAVLFINTDNSGHFLYLFSVSTTQLEKKGQCVSCVQNSPQYCQGSQFPLSKIQNNTLADQTAVTTAEKWD